LSQKKLELTFLSLWDIRKPELRVIRKSNTYSPNATLVPIRRKEGRNSKLELMSLSFCFFPQKRNPEATVLGL
jgi:hypothetical protein